MKEHLIECQECQIVGFDKVLFSRRSKEKITKLKDLEVFFIKNPIL